MTQFPQISPYLKCAGFAVALSALFLPAGSAQAATCPTPTPNVTSSKLPIDVDNISGTKCDLPPGNPIAFFDDFSWRAFIALVWPAANGQRGKPDTKKPLQNGVPLVFETYKADWESFPIQNSNPMSPTPTAWSTFAGAKNPCAQQVPNAKWGDMILASDTKFGNLGLAGFGAFLVGPVIVQPGEPGSNPSYVRYQAAYNETEYNQIFNLKWYILANIPSSGIAFCSNGKQSGGKNCPDENSVDIKASWIDMSLVPQARRNRYYSRQAWVFDPALPAGKACQSLTVGLVGLHIVVKTPSRPAWIWSSFEQIDNVPPVNAQPPFPQQYYNFHDGTATPMPKTDPWCVPDQNGKCPPQVPNAQPMPPAAPAPFNVTRTMPIHQSTISTNTAYQAKLQNTPWQFYQLVMTQWPIPPNSDSGATNNTFQGAQNTAGGSCPNKPTDPPNKDCTAFANVTMETFDQAAVGTGCMACHNATAHPKGAAGGNDFLWSLAVNAWRPPPPQGGPAAAAAAAAAASPSDRSLNELRDLLNSTVPDAGAPAK